MSPPPTRPRSAASELLAVAVVLLLAGVLLLALVGLALG